MQAFQAAQKAFKGVSPFQLVKNQNFVKTMLAYHIVRGTIPTNKMKNNMVMRPLIGTDRIDVTRR